MKDGKAMGMYAAIFGLLAGASAIGGGLYAHSVQPTFGFPWRPFGIVWDQAFSGVGTLIGLGILMVIGGLICFKWPSVGAIIVCVAAIIGLVYTYDHEWRRLPLLYYWAAPWILAWVTGIFAGYSLFQRTEPYGAEPESGGTDSKPAATESA